MAKAKLYRQNPTKKHTHTHSQKEKKEEVKTHEEDKRTALDVPPWIRDKR